MYCYPHFSTNPGHLVAPKRGLGTHGQECVDPSIENARSIRVFNHPSSTAAELHKNLICVSASAQITFHNRNIYWIATGYVHCLNVSIKVRYRYPQFKGANVVMCLLYQSVPTFILCYVLLYFKRDGFVPTLRQKFNSTLSTQKQPTLTNHHDRLVRTFEKFR